MNNTAQVNETVAPPRIEVKIKKHNEATNETIIVELLLADDCKNGHQDFSITGNVYHGQTCSGRNLQSCGSIHDDILATLPELKQFVDLHLSDYTGAPMYAVENGRYHMGDKAVAMEYLRITEPEFIALTDAKDDNTFRCILESLGIPARWKIEADAAIAEIEKMSGQKFLVNSTRSNYVPYKTA